jgi:large subunit ribosomal protein L4
MASELITELTAAITVPVVNAKGQSVGSETINPSDFGGKINRTLLHEVVLMYQANQRAGTHSTLRRGEVAGSTKKLFKQKGTGNARVGTKRTNKRRGGGTAKGPKPRDYSYSLPRKAIQSATRMAILSKLVDGEAIVVDSFGLGTTPKTKMMHSLLKAVKIGKKTKKKGDVSVEVDVTLADGSVLIGTAGNDPAVYRSARNIEGVVILPAAEFNAYSVLKQKRLVLTRDALDLLRNKNKN